MKIISAFPLIQKTVFASVLIGCSAFVYAEVGGADNAIVIGQTVGITGQIAGPVKEMMAGANAYFSAANKAGGVYGRKIELRSLDDKFDPALAASNAEILIKKSMCWRYFNLAARGIPKPSCRCWQQIGCH